jgi:hypothetical protein
MSILLRAMLIFAISACAHYFSAHAYVYFCAPTGWFGFLTSPFIAENIHCHALRWTLNHSIETMNVIVVFVGSTIIHLFESARKPIA